MAVKNNHEAAGRGTTVEPSSPVDGVSVEAESESMKPLIFSSFPPLAVNLSSILRWSVSKSLKFNVSGKAVSEKTDFELSCSSILNLS